MIGLIVWYLIWAYLAILTVRAVISIIPLLVRDWQPRGPLLVIAEAVYTLTDPPLKLLRKVIKPVRIGQTSWDLAFLVLYFGLTILQRILLFIF